MGVGENRQDKLSGQRGITRDVGPLGIVCDEPTRRQEDVIAGGCYGNNDRARTTAPVRPEGSMSSITGHVTVQVDQLNGTQAATF